MEKPVVFRNKGQQLIGILHIPDGATPPLPAVLMLHGFTGHKIETHRLFVRTARRIAEAGIAAFRFDFRGSGDSEGKFEDMTIYEELSDALKAFELLSEDFHEVDSRRLGVLGFSLGGCVAAMLAGRVGERVKALALWSAVSEDPPDNFRFFRSLFDNREDKSTDWVEHSGYRVGKAFFEELENVTPLKDVSSYRGPAIILHGSEDKTVSPEHAVTYYETLKRNNGDVEMHIIEGAGHTYLKRAHEEQLIDLTVKFFQRHLID